MKIRLRLGDCIERLKELPDNSVDDFVCDPPYFLEFMNEEWDKAVAGDGDMTEGQAVQASHEAWLREAVRVLKPGGRVHAFSGTRTHHRLAAAMQAVGLGVGWSRNWVHGQGFAKGTDISKGIDKVKGATRKIVGYKKGVGGENLNDIVRGKAKIRSTSDKGGKGVGAYGTGAKQVPVDVPVTVPATPEAEQWDGWKTGLSPNWEPVLLGVKEGDPELRAGSTKVVWVTRKPMSGSVVRNTLEHGCGGINVGATRIGNDEVTINRWTDGAKVFGGGAGHPFHSVKTKGRWPKNVILLHTPECEPKGRKKVRVGTAVRHRSGGKNVHSQVKKPTMDDMSYAGEDGLEDTVAWECEHGCPVRRLDELSGNGASHFFLQVRGKPYGLPEVLWSHLQALVAPPDGKLLLAQEETLGEVGLKDMDDASVHAMIVEGDPREHTADIYRVLKPGAHLLVISPDEQLTGHTAACRVEDEGFEIRDSILLLDENKSFFYTPKPAGKEKHSGVTERVRQVEITKEVEDEDGEVHTVTEVVERRTCNNHPTVKPRAMFEAILREIPADHLVIDPFFGSGTSALACLATGHDFIGIERDPEFLGIADERVRFWDAENATWNAASIESEAPPTDPEILEISPIEALFGVDPE